MKIIDKIKEHKKVAIAIGLFILADTFYILGQKNVIKQSVKLKPCEINLISNCREYGNDFTERLSEFSGFNPCRAYTFTSGGQVRVKDIGEATIKYFEEIGRDINDDATAMVLFTTKGD